MPRYRTDPLVAALISKLPASGEQWPVDRQLAWLHAMAVMFGVVYGGNAAAQLGKPPEVISAPEKPKPSFRFYIDEQGYARSKGKRILPKDVTDILYDLRGEMGDVGTIVWADDSRGINGADLTISAPL